MTTTDIAIHGGSALAITSEQTEFTSQQIAALQQLGVEAASDGDLRVFFHQSQRTGLDPFAKQIYMIGRTSKKKDNRGQWHETTTYTIQTGIDGYRLVARRAADQRRESLGYMDTLWCGQDGRWTDVWLSDEYPAAAKVTVLRNGHPFPAVALWKEYVQTKKDYNTSEIVPNAMWAKMGANQLAKCAEALALRKAFPQDLSGIYTTDEMGQAEDAPRVHAAPTVLQVETSARLADATELHPTNGDGEPLRTPTQAATLGRLLREKQWTDKDEALAWIGDLIGRDIDSTKDLTVTEAQQVNDHLQSALDHSASPVTGEVV